MLILTRKRGESLLIGGAVLNVVAIEGRRVRLGIQAPRETHILRAEIADVDICPLCRRAFTNEAGGECCPNCTKKMEA